MNLYDLHPDPASAPYRDWAFERVPELVWEKCWAYRYYQQSEKLKEHEPVFARSAKYAYFYARDVLARPFPAGEPAIAGDARYAHLYARHVLALRGCEAMTWPARPTLWQRLKYALWDY